MVSYQVLLGVDRAAAGQAQETDAQGGVAVWRQTGSGARFNAVPCILNCHFNKIPRIQILIFGCRTLIKVYGFQIDLQYTCLIVHGMDGIGAKVHEDLAHFSRICQDHLPFTGNLLAYINHGGNGGPH